MNMFIKPGQPITTGGQNLAGLWRPSFVKVDTRLYVFGGGGNVTDDLHYLDLQRMQWHTVQNVTGTPPCKRYGHTACRWKEYIVIFGGCNEYQEYCGDVHLFNLTTSTWSKPNVTGMVCARYLHSATISDNKLIIYGGFAKSSDCTYVLDELCVLDLNNMIWEKYHDMPPRYNHSATLVGNKMYIYAGKDEQGNTVSDLFMVNLSKSPYTTHLVLSGDGTNGSSSSNSSNSGSSYNPRMVLLKSQHFCDTACGKLIVFGRYLNHSSHKYAHQISNHSNSNSNNNNQQQQQQQQQQQLTANEATYSLWMLDLDTLVWEKQECDGHFDEGGWNYFTIISEKTGSSGDADTHNQININNLLFLGNTDPYRPQGYDHFRDALVIHGESLGLYDIAEPRFSTEFIQLLNSPELSDFSIIAANGEEIYVHQVILLTRWPHFKHIHKSGMSEAIERRMTIPEPVEVIMAFLKFLYSDRLDDNEPWPVVCDLLVMANMYMLHRLKKLCCERLYKRHLTIESCGLIFEKAIMAEEVGLKLLALRFMFQNYGYILKTNMLMELPCSVRDEFLEAVPEDAVLEVAARSRYYPAVSLTASSTQQHIFSQQAHIMSQQQSYSSSTISQQHHAISSSGNSSHNLYYNSNHMETSSSSLPNHANGTTANSENDMTTTSTTTTATSFYNHPQQSVYPSSDILLNHQRARSNDMIPMTANNNSDMTIEV